MWEPFTHGKPSEAAALSAAASIGKQQLFFDCVHFWAVSQVLEGAFPNGRASGTTTFPQRQGIGKQPLVRRMRSPAGSTNGIGDNDLSPTAGHREATAIFRLRSHLGGIAGIVGAARRLQACREAAALSANAFPGRQYQRHRGLPSSFRYSFCNFQKGY